MTEKREVIRRLRHGQSIRQIHRETGIHRTILRKLKALSQEKGWLDRERRLPPEIAISRLLAKENTQEVAHPLDRFKERIQQWLADKTSYLLIHEFISEELEISEATVRRYCKKQFPGLPKMSYLRPTIPGEVMEVDFGFLGITYDTRSRRNRKTYVFSARLRHSRYAWRECVYDQKKLTFFRCHIHAFEYFGGVPEKVVPDNLKAAVVKASFTEPIINRVYLRLAEHYGFLIDPTPPASPELKGGVENEIKYIKRNFWPRYREAERRKGHEVPHGDILQQELEKWSDGYAHARTIGGIGARPVDLFGEEEKPALLPLPPTRWKEITWQTAKVQESWRIQVDRAFYSVPYRLIGTQVVVYLTSDSVEIYEETTLVAVHQRAERQWQCLRNPAHDPPNIEEVISHTRQGLLFRAATIGNEVAEVTRAIISRKNVDGLRPARALLALKSRYGEARLIAACRRALLYDSPEYAVVKKILSKGLDKLEEETVVNSEGNYCFTFARSPEYFEPQRRVEAVR
jgi:transposase